MIVPASCGAAAVMQMKRRCLQHKGIEYHGEGECLPAHDHYYAMHPGRGCSRPGLVCSIFPVGRGPQVTHIDIKILMQISADRIGRPNQRSPTTNNTHFGYSESFMFSVIMCILRYSNPCSHSNPVTEKFMSHRLHFFTVI